MLRQGMKAVLVCVATLLTPAALSAQFTTFVAPPRKAVADTARPTVAAAKAKADSVTRMSLSDMKAWVDSAAGTGTQVATASDTSTAAVVTTTPPNVDGRTTTTTFSSGAIAPNTATSLPTYFVAGLTLGIAGAFLLRRRQTS